VPLLVALELSDCQIGLDKISTDEGQGADSIHCDGIKANSYTSYRSSDDKLRKRICRALQDGADDNDDMAPEDHPQTSKTVAQARAPIMPPTSYMATAVPFILLIISFQG
jgi:hypothetical protein